MVAVASFDVLQRLVSGRTSRFRLGDIRMITALRTCVGMVALCLISLLAPCQSDAAEVVGYELASSTRVGRTTVDYAYRIRVTNTGPALSGATARVVSSAAATVIIDGEIVLGSVPANTTLLSADTFMLRQDRALPFDPSVLSWTVSSTSTATVPNVVGMTQSAAIAAVSGAGLTVGTITQQASATVLAGRVISQSPSGGTTANAAAAVNLIVSSGPSLVSAPSVVGLTQAAATSAITTAGLVVSTVARQSSATVAAGRVISQNPLGGASVAAGSAINLVVSSGPALASVPNLVGLAQSAAISVISNAGLLLGTITQQSSASIPAGTLISQSPSGGSIVTPGSAVNIVVSSGPARVSVPAVVGLTQAAASAAITNAGLIVGTVSQQSSATVPVGAVISQNPSGGTNVGSGSAVSIIVSSGPASAGAVLLPGAPMANARAAITAYYDPSAGAGGGVEADATGIAFSRTKLTVDIAADATVGQVNAALTAAGASVYWMRPDRALIEVHIPDPGSLNAVNSIANQLAASPGIVSARPHLVHLAPFEVPPNTPGVPAAPDTRIRHQLAAKAHAAWNARGLLIPRPSLPSIPDFVIVDWFGNGEPSAGFQYSLRSGAFISTTSPDDHGYGVLSLAIADFGGGTDARGVAAGAFPASAAAPVPLSVIDLTSLAYRSNIDVELAIIERVMANPANVIVNTSLGFLCGPQPNGSYAPQLSDASVNQRALEWIRRVRGESYRTAGSGLERRFLHVTAAGNPYLFCSDSRAEIQSQYAAAALMSIVDAAGNSVPSLTNTLVVENLTYTSVGGIPQARCLNDNVEGSATGGNIAAIGTDVYWITASGGRAVGNGGTSSAAPQVAGLGLYLWTAKPALTAQELKSRIIETADPASLCLRFSARQLNMYSALLSADEGAALRPDGNRAQAPVRTAILDVAGTNQTPLPEGLFTQYDIAKFVDELRLRNGVADFSRYDLNGDGYTGGTRAARLDLDADGQLSAQVFIPGYAATLNENSVTDAQALCYYSFSNLYSHSPGTDATRVDPRSLALIPIIDQCGLRVDRVRVSLGPTSPAITGAQTWTVTNPIELFSFGTGFNWPIFWVGNGICGSERGAPTWSSFVDAGARFLPATGVSNPAVPEGNFTNRLNCSSFIAVKGLRLWINASGRLETFSQFGTADREWQTRMFYAADDSTLLAETPLAPVSSYVAHVPVVNPAASGYVERRGAQFNVEIVFVAIQ